MLKRSTLASAAAIVSVLLAAPFYFLIFSISLNFFDTAITGSLRPWFIVGGTGLTSLAILCGSLFGSLRLIRAQKIVRGLVVSAVPVLCLALLWIWLMQQSFT